MEPLRRILVGLDGLDPAAQVIRYAAMVARLGCAARHDIALPRIRCAPAPMGRQLPPANSAACGSVAALRAANHDAEIRFVSLLRHAVPVEPSTRVSLLGMLNEHFLPAQRAAVSCDLLKGRPLQRLPELATDFDADLLLLDACTESRRRCARVATEAACPVWLVPRDAAPVLRRILVPIDFSPRSAACLRAALRLAERFRPAKCIALHVAPDRGRLDASTLDDSHQRELEDDFTEFIAGFDTRGVAVEPFFVKAGRFCGALQRITRECSIDLTILSARRRSRLAGTVLPSRTESAIRACSGAFLVLKSGARPLSLAEALHKRIRESDPPQFG